MDGYVSKPIRAAELLEVIERHVAGDPAAGAASPAWQPDSEPSSGEVLDRAALLDRVEGDTALLAELVELAIQDLPRLLREIRDAVARGDARALERAAHTLRGTVSSFAAPAATAAALRLELMGREGDLAQAEESCAALERELDCLKTSLAEVCQEVGR